MVLRIVGNARSAKGLGERLRVKQEASFYAFYTDKNRVVSKMTQSTDGCRRF